LVDIVEPDARDLTTDLAADTEPSVSTETALACIVADLLRLQSVSPLDDFVRLGGDSLTAVQLRLLIEQSFGARIPISFIFDNSRIDEIAAEISRRMITNR
jgi:pyochelin synthetase